ncbi:hypothetical protein, partial [Stenotrophomonas sp. YIM B06876]|uniref:hypothetical protein n=1 Tax=Stenotrophomonas sp. YIM B06876 TaxID=3060211 RepID=UPI00273A1F14
MHSAVQRQEEPPKGGAFFLAVNSLAQRLGTVLAPKSTPISIFKASYAGILKDADDGAVQVISQGKKKYVLLTEDQLVEIMDAGVGSKTRSLADTLASLTPPKERLDASLVMQAGSAHDPFSLPERAP